MLELVIIAVLALLLLGADRLPDAARTVGKGLRELRRATEDLKDQIETEVYADERKRRQLPVAPVPAGERSPEPPPSGPESVPGYLPGFEPPTPEGVSVEPESVAAPAPDAEDTPRS
jgi:sec-independent protein translocase protein TatB